jgi:hypothetical protein
MKKTVRQKPINGFLHFAALLLLSAAPLASGSVHHSIGVARDVDATVSYIEHHQYLESGHHLIRYYDNDLNLLLTKELSYPDLPQHPTLKQTDLVSQTEIKIEVDKTTALMSRPTSKGGDHFRFDLTADVMIDAGFDAYIRANWTSFKDQPSRLFRFAIAGQRRLIQMELSLLDDVAGGAVFSVKPRNWLLRKLIPKIILSYDAKRQLIRYQGFSNLKQPGEKRNVVISFDHYDSDTPLLMPLTEWLPEISGL